MRVAIDRLNQHFDATKFPWVNEAKVSCIIAAARLSVSLHARIHHLHSLLVILNIIFHYSIWPRFEKLESFRDDYEYDYTRLLFLATDHRTLNMISQYPSRIASERKNLVVVLVAM